MKQEGQPANAIHHPITVLAPLPEVWNTPPPLPTVRGEMTHGVIRFKKVDPETTRVSLGHDGRGKGGEWDQADKYFTCAWGDIVLPPLKYRTERGPINWEDPPDLIPEK